MIKNRILIKISGEALKNGTESAHDIKILDHISQNIKKLIENGYNVAIVIGGGNIYRGNSNRSDISRIGADYIGMLATIMNGIILSENMKKHKIDVQLMSSISMEQICESYSYTKALRYLEDNKVLILVGGTGNPFCTTDSAAILKAASVNCKMVLKATNIDGVYSDDPRKNSDAKRLDIISYDEIMSQKLNIMDIGSILMAKEFLIPIKIFNIGDDFFDIISGKGKFTLISEWL
jgi:uridylate kinase